MSLAVYGVHEMRPVSKGPVAQSRGSTESRTGSCGVSWFVRVKLKCGEETVKPESEAEIVMSSLVSRSLPNRLAGQSGTILKEWVPSSVPCILVIRRGRVE